MRRKKWALEIQSAVGLIKETLLDEEDEESEYDIVAEDESTETQTVIFDFIVATDEEIATMFSNKDGVFKVTFPKNYPIPMYIIPSFRLIDIVVRKDKKPKKALSPTEQANSILRK